MLQRRPEDDHTRTHTHNSKWPTNFEDRSTPMWSAIYFVAHFFNLIHFISFSLSLELICICGNRMNRFHNKCVSHCPAANHRSFVSECVCVCIWVYDIPTMAWLHINQPNDIKQNICNTHNLNCIRCWYILLILL